MLTIAGHTLFPHGANWSQRPAWRRRWLTGIGTAVTGAEQRTALRKLPLHTLTASITAASLEERGRLDARIDQAKKSGLAALPFFGRGTFLDATSAAGTNTLTLRDAEIGWGWANGDFAILLNTDLQFDVLAVVDVDSPVITLAANLTYTWQAGEMVWPLLFGKFTSEKQDQLTNWHAAVRLTITQQVAERTAQLGNVVPDTGRGVGHDHVGSTNVIG